MAKGELALIEWIREQAKSQAAGLPLGIGDDMACLACGDGQVLVTTDILLDGVHFQTEAQELRRIGRKALACSLSDAAAMASKPIGAVVSVALPAGFTFEQAQQLHGGICDMGREYDCPLVGGDTTSWPGQLVINVALLAVPDGITPVTRRGARVGDEILVTGRLGGSILGRHLDFEPRVREARHLAKAIELHAMIDLSDGLSTDIHHICDESQVGAVIDAQCLQKAVSPAAQELSRQDGKSPLDHALNDGEDFELLMAAPPGTLAFLLASKQAPACGLTRIGQITGSGVHLRGPDGEIALLSPKGFEHFK